MIKEDLIQEILKLKPDYSQYVGRLFRRNKDELQEIYEELKTGSDPGELEPLKKWNPGYIRPIDDLGRIVIPKALRKAFNIQPGDRLIIKRTANQHGKSILIMKEEE